jgi:hypothetical protein
MSQIRSTRSAAVLALLSLIFIQACGTTPTESTGPGSIFVTSRTGYEIPTPSNAVAVTFVATNTLAEPIALDRDRRDLHAIEKNVGGSWVHLYSVPHLAYWAPPIFLEPGETRTYEFTVDASSGPGLYRAVFGVGYPGRGGAEARSNAFEVRM